MRPAVIVAAARTPFGRFGGALRPLSAVELGALAIREVTKRAALSGDEVDEVILGNAASAGLGQVPARQAALRAGLSEKVRCIGVDKACVAAMVAMRWAWWLVAHEEAEVVIAGGMESMSNVPYILPQARWGYRLGHAPLVDALTAALTCPISGKHMGIFASEVALEHGIDRKQQDLWALRSHMRYQEALQAGKWKDEVFAVEVPDKKGTVIVTTDEQPRADTSYEKLAALPPAFEEQGTVTAGNAPGLNDGAAMVVIMSANKARERGLEPLARILAIGQASAAPRLINVVPALAAEDALARARLDKKNIVLWEINEAFAATTLTAIKILGIDPEKVNVNGGSVAIGHPVGATGARILMTLVYELRRRGGGLGLAAICGAGAQGEAMLVAT
ncbi:MAG: thiolase family protein [Chloroflexi bacterium]|nr:thiolase family protein [Chloroflexota bacterium]